MIIVLVYMHIYSKHMLMKTTVIQMSNLSKYVYHILSSLAVSSDGQCLVILLKII